MDTRDESLSEQARHAARTGMDHVENATHRAADRVEGAAEGMRDDLATGDTDRVVGVSVGGIGGAAAGAALGSLLGPVGTIIGGIAGAVGGWWAGRAVTDAVTGYTDSDDARYRQHFDTTRQGSESGTRSSFDEARPAYQLGHVARQNPDYQGRPFNDVEPDLRRGWSPELERHYGSWNDVRSHVGSAFESDAEQRVTRTEEELAVGKRAVVKEESIVKKQAVSDMENVEADLPKERVDVDDPSRTQKGTERSVRDEERLDR